MRNEDKITCRDSDCVGKVFWQSSDGSAYNEHIPDHNLFIEDHKCTRMKDATVIESEKCHQTRNKYVCEFTCPQPTAATPSPAAADEEASTGML